MTPDVRVVRGEPDDEELAALVAGLAAGAATAHDHGHGHGARASAREAGDRRRWREAARPLTDPLTPGPDAWRWSAHR